MLAKACFDCRIVSRMRTMEPSEIWEFGREAAELMQLRRDAACSFRENLIWLEEITEFKTRFAKECWIRNLAVPPGLSKKVS